MPADICIKPSQTQGNYLFCCFAGVSTSVTWRSYFTVLSLGLLAIRSTKAKLTLGENAIIGSIFKHLLETVNTADLHPSALSRSVSWINLLHFLRMKVIGKIAAVHCISSNIESSHLNDFFFSEY